MSAAEERRSRLLHSVGRTGTARLTELADELGVSIATIRRDAELLRRRGRLVRRHGSVELIPRPDLRRGGRPATIGMMHSANRYLALIAQAARREAERRDHRFLIEPVETQPDADRAAGRLVAAGCIGLIRSSQGVGSASWCWTGARSSDRRQAGWIRARWGSLGRLAVSPGRSPLSGHAHHR